MAHVDDKYAYDGKLYAEHILKELEGDSSFYFDGRRNDDAVDLSIACHVLGKDPELVAHEILHQHYGPYTAAIKYSDFQERYAVIEPYLPEWDRCGIFNYLIQSYQNQSFKEQVALELEKGK